MTACNQQIVISYEDLSMSPEEIAEDQEMELTSVKAVLLQFSLLYRNAVKGSKDKEVGFSEEDHQMALDVITNTARYSEDEHLRLKAAAYIRDDRKGRLDAVKNAFGAVNFNVLAFNEIMQKAIQAKNKAKGLIDVKSETTVAA